MENARLAMDTPKYNHNSKELQHASWRFTPGLCKGSPACIAHKFSTHQNVVANRHQSPGPPDKSWRIGRLVPTGDNVRPTWYRRRYWPPKRAQEHPKEILTTLLGCSRAHLFPKYPQNNETKLHSESQPIHASVHVKLDIGFQNLDGVYTNDASHCRVRRAHGTSTISQTRH